MSATGERGSKLSATPEGFRCTQNYSGHEKWDLWDPTDCSPLEAPPSMGLILTQARLLEAGYISSSKGSSDSGDEICVSMSPALAERVLYH